MRDYTNRYSQLLLRIGAVLLVLGIVNFVLTQGPDILLAALFPLLAGVMLKVFPVVRVGVDQVEIHRGVLKPKIVVPFTGIGGIDESHSKFIRLSTDDGEVHIPTAVLGKGERASLIEDLRMGTKQARAGSTRGQGRPANDV